jgi:tRNA nucleotidyltransferase/poly(A) polymerase
MSHQPWRRFAPLGDKVSRSPVSITSNYIRFHLKAQYWRHCATDAAAVAPTELRGVVSTKRITLDSTEVELFDFIRDACRDLGLTTTVRVAGGWVRDKLLGLQSTDIDIAVDDMSGEKFASLLIEYASRNQQEMIASEAKTTRLNPEQSKHLETTMVRLFDKEIDFARLRTDSYASDDLTINSLFYNINTDSIEDWCGRGLSDLQAGRIITPLDPALTLSDDPLRALRIIRFTAKYEFELDPAMSEALNTFDKSLLLRKVSNDRIGIEIKKMLSAPSSRQIVKAFAAITELKFYNTVFQESLAAPWPHASAVEGLRRLTLMSEYIEDPASQCEVTNDAKMAILILAYVSPFLPQNSATRRGRPELEVFLHKLFTVTLKVPSNPTLLPHRH